MVDISGLTEVDRAKIEAILNEWATDQIFVDEGMDFAIHIYEEMVKVMGNQTITRNECYTISSVVETEQRWDLQDLLESCPGVPEEDHRP